MDPAKQVGGDFYDFFFVGPGKLALVIADVSGKGIPAVLFIMRSKTAIRTIAEQDYSPVEVLEKANLSLCEGNDEKMFVSVWLGIIDLNETKKATMKETLLAVTKDIESFTTDAEQFDDITMLGFRYLGSEP